MRSIGREPVLVLDRNIFSRLINVVSKGKTDEGSTKDIAFLIVWSVLNDVKILPYYALNEVAEGKIVKWQLSVNIVFLKRYLQILHC